MSNTENILSLTSEMVLGYFESLKSCFYVKLGMILWFDAGSVEKHRDLSTVASAVAAELEDELATKVLSSIQPEVVANLKEDAVTGLILSGWAVFEQVIKDLTVPDYANQSTMLQADFNNGILGFSQSERDEIALFYHLRNAIAHYNGAYHAYRTVDITYRGKHFTSNGHFGEKIELTPKLSIHIIEDLQRYAMKAWTHRGRS
jgi:hypothetical protein